MVRSARSSDGVLSWFGSADPCAVQRKYCILRLCMRGRWCWFVGLACAWLCIGFGSFGLFSSCLLVLGGDGVHVHAHYRAVRRTRIWFFRRTGLISRCLPFGSCCAPHWTIVATPRSRFRAPAWRVAGIIFAALRHCACFCACCSVSVHGCWRSLALDPALFRDRR